MRRPRLLAAALAGAALLIPATPAAAGDPIMPLGEVRSGMQCTGLSVVRGTDVVPFDIEVIDVVDDRAGTGGPRILFRASGPAVDETGLGEGFSGSPIYCPDAAGTPRNIGAISEAIGEYGGKVALATPIEAILGNPVDAPHARTATALLARARPLAAPLTITGLNPRLGRALQLAAARQGKLLLATPAGPAGTFPVQQLRPGSAFAVGYASGDISAGAIGTVAYTDGNQVWGFGHPLDSVGARALLLEDAYVFRVVNNPLGIPPIAGTYKFAAAGHDIGTLTNDALSAVVGRVGALPDTIPVRVSATDVDRGTGHPVATNVADESAVDQPTGSSILSLVGPLAVSEAAGTVLLGSPARLTGRGCFTIALRELPEPAHFCNRYVTDTADPLSGNVVAATASSDLLQALTKIDTYKASDIHVNSVDVDVDVRRGQRQAYLREVNLPDRGRAGAKVTATVTLRHVRGAQEKRRVEVRLPEELRPGKRKIVFTGTDVDTGDGGLFDLFDFALDLGGGGGQFGPANPRKLVESIEKIHRYDGVSARPAGADADDEEATVHSFRAADVRISGKANATIRIRKG
jgi:hypothetical protein